MPGPQATRTQARELVLEQGEKNFCKKDLDIRMNLYKGWKQGRDENKQEDYSTTEIW